MAPRQGHVCGSAPVGLPNDLLVGDGKITATDPPSLRPMDDSVSQSAPREKDGCTPRPACPDEEFGAAPDGLNPQGRTRLSVRHVSDLAQLAGGINNSLCA